MNKKWNTNDIASQEGKVFLVTGANSGLGLGTTKVLAAKGAKVVMTARNIEKGKQALREVKQVDPQAKVALMQLDLADLQSIEQFTTEFKRNFQQLDVLINNAGVMMPNERLTTKQGLEVQFGTNHIGHFVLTQQLLPVLENTPNARIVTLSSLVAKMSKADIYWDDLQWEKSYDKMGAYAQSKLSNLMFALELDQRLKATNSQVISLAAHPGYTATNLQQHMGLTGKVMNFLLAQKLEMGILPTLRAATDSEAKGGQYYGPLKWREMRGYPALNEPPELALNKQARVKLWDISEQYAQASFAV
ncbi:MAG TPA: short-chain dehydrogenase [Microscillaceae bacterium]|nr:short-chain dehydrogenase [Microscillaceae bacterium]